MNFVMIIVGIIFSLFGVGFIFLLPAAIKDYKERKHKWDEFLRFAVKTKGTIIKLKPVRLTDPILIRTGRGGTYKVYDVVFPVYEYTDLYGNRRVLDTEIEQKGLYDQYQFYISRANLIPLAEGDQKTIYYRPDTGEQYVEYNMKDIHIMTQSGFMGCLVYALYPLCVLIILFGIALIYGGISG